MGFTCCNPSQICVAQDLEVGVGKGVQEGSDYEHLERGGLREEKKSGHPGAGSRLARQQESLIPEGLPGLLGNQNAWILEDICHHG